ncbi:MAG TPA: hypothetical protein VJ455_08050 [Ignavibacteria bacterium]|nr:hypothetical protein [Ignavibacteria bacterium]
MKHLKLFSILKTFTNDELAGFGKFLASPYFNQNENVIKLFNTINVYHPDYSSDNLANENLHRNIYPGAKINFGSINNLVTRLINLAERFLVVNSFEEDSSVSNQFLLRQFEERGLDSLFESTIKKTKSEIEKQCIHDENYYRNMYDINELEIIFNRNRKPLGKMKTDFDKIPLSIQYLLYYFYQKIFDNYVRFLDAEHHVKLDEGNLWIKKVTAKILKNTEELPYNLLIDIYKRTTSFAELKDEYNIDETINLVIDYKNSLPANMLKLVLSLLYDYCKDKEFDGDKSYGLKSFMILKLMVENKVILNYDGTLTDHEYVNYSAAAVREKEMEWAEDFTNRFKQYIAPARREDAYNYNHAVINYIRGCDDKERKYFESALQFLSKVNASDFYYKTRIFLLSMNIFYEISETDTLISLIDSFKHYLTAHKSEMPPDLEERYLNFANFLLRLVNLKENPKLSAALKLKKDILGTKEKVEFKKRLVLNIDEIIKDGHLEKV